MTREQVLIDLEEIASLHLGRAGGLRLEMDLIEDLELDSLLLLTLAVEVENRFEICLDQEEEATIRTVGDLAETVMRKVSEKPGIERVR
jgi:acyl carrier protein